MAEPPGSGRLDGIPINFVFRYQRIAALCSQAELAEQLQVSRQTINSIERGRSLPSLPLALALARFLETTVEELFTPPVEPEGKVPR